MAESNKGMHTGDEPGTSAQKRADKFGDKTVGTGMTSPDSTEAVLDSTTGDPDPRATGKGGKDSGSKQE